LDRRLDEPQNQYGYGGEEEENAIIAPVVN